MVITRRGFIGAAIAASAVSCGPLRSLAQHGMAPGALSLRGSTTVPFVLGGNHIYIRAMIGRSAYAFIFDTGGTAIVLPEVQRALKFPVIGSVHAVGFGTVEQDVDVVRVPEATIGTATYRDGPFVVMDIPVGPSPLPGLRFAGIFGREFFTVFVTVIDYEKQTLTFHDARSFQADPAAIALPLEVVDGHPRIRGTIDGHDGSFDIDTGSGQGLTLFKGFAESSGILKAFPHTSPAVVGHGTGGLVTGVAGRAKTLALGSLQVADVIVGVPDADSGAFSKTNLAGNIGGDILRRFTLTLDAPHSRLYLKPNARFHDPFVFNRAGLFSERNDTGERVIFVAPNGPAAQAGIAAGDNITRIDGLDVMRMSQDRVRSTWLRPSGTTVALELKRNARAIHASFVLRDLL